MGDTEILLDADEVARRIGCTRRHVERLNSEGQGPPSVRIGRRLRRYPERLFEEWIKSLHGDAARNGSGKKILDGLEDALAQNVKRYTNIYTIDDGRIEEARQMTLRETVDALRAIPGSGWKDIDDPLAELRRLRGGDEISGVDAHFLLFAIDAYVATDREGRVTEPRNGLSLEGWQQIRDRLFEMHEHPAE